MYARRVKKKKKYVTPEPTAFLNFWFYPFSESFDYVRSIHIPECVWTYDDRFKKNTCFFYFTIENKSKLYTEVQ